MQLGVYTVRPDGSLVHELDYVLGADKRKDPRSLSEKARTAPACPCGGTENPRLCPSRS